jgi:Raf kinase inhibitor-like YbhB/YbcL family protein
MSMLAIGLVAGSGETGLLAQSSTTRLARARLGPAPIQLTVTSSAFTAGAEIPVRNVAKADRWSPPLAWTGHPPATESFVVVVEDSDARQAWQSPYVVWLLFNIDGYVTSLPEGVPSGTHIPDFGRPRQSWWVGEYPGYIGTYGGAFQGRTTGNHVGFFGPELAMGEPPHRLHFQVFALDRRLYAQAGSSLDELVVWMQGHVLAHGELVGMFQRGIRQP